MITIMVMVRSRHMGTSVEESGGAQPRIVVTSSWLGWRSVWLVMGLVLGLGFLLHVGPWREWTFSIFRAEDEELGAWLWRLALSAVLLYFLAVIVLNETKLAVTSELVTTNFGPLPVPIPFLRKRFKVDSISCFQGMEVNSMRTDGYKQQSSSYELQALGGRDPTNKDDLPARVLNCANLDQARMLAKQLNAFLEKSRGQT